MPCGTNAASTASSQASVWLPMFFLELCTGLRKGELVALLWSDLDIEKKTITVNKQAARVKGGGVKVLTAKTSTSIRVESVPQEAIDLLIQEHEKHPEAGCKILCKRFSTKSRMALESRADSGLNPCYYIFAPCLW